MGAPNKGGVGSNRRTNHISVTPKAKVVTFRTQVVYVKSQHKNNKNTLKRGVIMVT